MRVIAPTAIINVPMTERTTSGVIRLVNPDERRRRARGRDVAAAREEERVVFRVATG